MASFKLNLKALPFESQSVTYRLGADFFPDDEPAEVIAADIEVEAVIARKSECDYELSLSCHGTLTIPCDRCLDPMAHQVDTTYRLSVRQEGESLDDSRDNLLVVPEQWRELDIEPIVRDSVLLTIPIMHTHAPGECNEQMMEQLQSHHAQPGGEASGQSDGGDDQATDPRWDALRKLKNNN